MSSSKALTFCHLEDFSWRVPETAQIQLQLIFISFQNIFRNLCSVDFKCFLRCFHFCSWNLSKREFVKFPHGTVEGHRPWTEIIFSSGSVTCCWRTWGRLPNFWASVSTLQSQMTNTCLVGLLWRQNKTSCARHPAPPVRPALGPRPSVPPPSFEQHHGDWTPQFLALAP